MRATVRAAGPADAGFLADAWHAMALESGIAPNGFAAGWRERLAACFKAGIGAGSHGWFVAVVGDQLVGSAAALQRGSVFGEVMRRRTAVLAGVYVLPEFRRHGIARELVVRAIAWARERACTHVSLHATACAEPLYRTLGFEDERSMVLKLQ